MFITVALHHHLINNFTNVLALLIPFWFVNYLFSSTELIMHIMQKFTSICDWILSSLHATDNIP